MIAALHALVLLALAICDGELALVEAVLIAAWSFMGWHDQTCAEPGGSEGHWTGYALAAGWAALTVCALCDPGETRAWGFAVLLVGLGMRTWALRVLRGSYRDDLEPERLVTTGPYRWIRHPGEVGAFVVALGSALVVGSWTALAVVVLWLAPATWIRLRLEEVALTEAFGSRYTAYARRVGGPTARL